VARRRYNSIKLGIKLGSPTAGSESHHESHSQWEGATRSYQRVELKLRAILEIHAREDLRRVTGVFGLTSDWSWFPVGYTTHILTEMCSRVGYLGAMPGNTRLLRIT